MNRRAGAGLSTRRYFDLGSWSWAAVPEYVSLRTAITPTQFWEVYVDTAWPYIKREIEAELEAEGAAWKSFMKLVKQTPDQRHRYIGIGEG